MPLSLVSTWYGAFVLDRGRVVRSAPFPREVSALRERLVIRRTGGLTAEENRLVAELKGTPMVTRDRRFESAGVSLGPTSSEGVPPAPAGLRELVLETAEATLRDSWDPSIHIEEAVRAMTELDQTINLLGERLSSWLSRDAPIVEETDVGSLRTIAKRVLEDDSGAQPALPGADPELGAARREVARLYLDSLRAKEAVEQAVLNALPRKAPNVSALLGPALAARLMTKAGGLDRLARLPASTIQVLGAEKAFFEHLRGRAPPPRHGLLFLHPDIQGAPRRARGKLARALAGKVAIAARMDREGSPIREDLANAFRARRDAIRSEPVKPARGTRPRGSAPPLDRAAEHR